MKRKPELKDMVGYPWQETVKCACGRTYGVDYRQDRDWSRCPWCTGEAGKPCRNFAQLQEIKK